ncbi:SCP2 sterol-binding domain-containing protein [Thermoplasma volcanium]|nr:SCP2 sterol-binding domain-containing protein [Thermoplasma volcanium]
MAKFPSDEWVSEYCNRLNNNPDYADAGKTWEGDILFVVQPDENYSKTEYIYIDLYHGKCRSAKYVHEGEEVPKAEFRYVGKYGNWIRLLNKEIDPIQGILTGKFKLEGSMMKIMRYTKAAKEMVNTAAQVKTEF